MNQEDQRDHAEEAANRATADREAREELAVKEAKRQLIMMEWRAIADTSARVALINMADLYVRHHPRGETGDTLAWRLMAIMVCALHGVGAEEANVIVTEEIRAAERRKGFWS